MKLRTCIDPSGRFIYGVHKPGFRVRNLRENDYTETLGVFLDGRPWDNRANFPPGDVDEASADPIFEIPNPFPFKGVTFISRAWADEKAKDPLSIMLPERPPVSFVESLQEWPGETPFPPGGLDQIFKSFPGPVRLAVAGTSTDHKDLVCLAELSCGFVHDRKGLPVGLKFRADENGNPVPVIYDRILFEILANNPCLPDAYKTVMVLRPGAQGKSEIVGEYSDADEGTHVFEYLRRNSYIPWGHYAANMAHDAVRYRLRDLSLADMRALRHLYYQRSFVRLADELGIFTGSGRRRLAAGELEDLRLRIMDTLSSSAEREKLKFNRTLWGWNFGFDYAPSSYRLHASHQQVHQQFGMIPRRVEVGCEPGAYMPAYACGDLVSDFIARYKEQTGKDFFTAYIRAIETNRRMDEKTDNHSLVVYSDDQVMLFVPKAQTSQWELQLMSLQPVGNVLEADARRRDSIDFAMLVAVRVLESMGARLIHSIEYSKPFDETRTDQHLLYAFLPRLPESPGAFSEAQLRWINGHYPEDFAAACRSRVLGVLNDIKM